MKKFTFVLVILCIICQGLLAVTFVESSGGDLPKGSPVVTARIDPSLMAVSDMGFTQGKPDLNGAITKLDKVEITDLVVDTETFKSKPFYMYWNILGGTASIPTINLKINGALVSVKGGHSVNWKVTWMEGTEEKSVDSINHKTQQIYPVETSSKSSENVLKRVSGFRELTVHTTDEFWKAPMDKYESQLWIEIVT